MDRKKICRLCAKNCLKQQLTSLDDPIRCIRSKLFRCSQIDITDDNKALPQNVCKDCVNNLEQCWNFTETVAAAQTKLQLQFADDPLSGVKVEEVIIGEDQFQLPTDYDAVMGDDDHENESEGNTSGCNLPVIANPPNTKSIQKSFQMNPTIRKSMQPQVWQR